MLLAAHRRVPLAPDALALLVHLHAVGAGRLEPPDVGPRGVEGLRGRGVGGERTVQDAAGRPDPRTPLEPRVHPLGLGEHQVGRRRGIVDGSDPEVQRHLVPPLLLGQDVGAREVQVGMDVDQAPEHSSSRCR